MLKRDLAGIGGVQMDVDGPRTKRRRDAAGTASSPPAEEPQTTSAGSEGKKKAAVVEEDQERVREVGRTLWETVKNAVDKDQRSLSEVFMKLPLKKDYPDYYDFIKKPVALDTIKRHLDKGEYPTVDAVRADFEQMFVNAKRYNLRDSVVWKDAKVLHKMVRKQYAKLTGRSMDEHPDGEGGEHGAGGSGDEAKTKKPNLQRQMKSKLQKLVNKTDDDGRLLSSEFMELPDKKIWAIYYKTITKPICFEDIFRRIRQHEYTSSAEFANDVELIFDNALQFNADHTPVWEDAQQLRAAFKKLMADLPEQFALPQYAPAPSAGKIKLKVPRLPPDQASSISARIPAPAAPIQLPPQSITAPPVKISPAIAVATSAATASASAVQRKPAQAPSLPYMPAQVLPVAPATASSKPPVIAPTPTLQPVSSYYTRPPTYVQPAPPVPSGSSSSTPAPAPAPPVIQPSTSASPVPMPPPTLHPLSTVAIQIEPTNRRLDLLHTDGVKSWMLRFVRGESSLRINRIGFLPAPENEESGDEDAMDVDEVEEDEDEDESPKSSKGKVKRGRGRPPRKSPVKEKPKENGVKVPPKKKEPREVVVKLNGVVVPELVDDDGGHWSVKPSAGVFNVLEIGSKGGMVWKVYVQTTS